VSISVHEDTARFVVDFKPVLHRCITLNREFVVEEVVDGAVSECWRVGVSYFRLDADPHGRAGPVPGSASHFEVPWERYKETYEAFNTLAERWPGEGPDLGGTWVEVEQFLGGKLRSSSSNSQSPFAPTAGLLKHVHSLLLAYAPVGTVPRSVDFSAGDRFMG
jgi:hypothetical protein